MKSNPALRKLAEKIIRTEIEKRNPLDTEVLTRFVSQSADVTEDGEIVVKDVTGSIVMNGTRPVSLVEHLDTIERDRPTLFRSGSAQVEKTPPEVNPFARARTST